jgi:hypothetical protein
MGLSVSPTDPNVIVAGVEFGALVRSEDGGRTWSNHRKGALRDCHSLTFHATNGNWVYEGGGGATVSRDGGLTCAANSCRRLICLANRTPLFTARPAARSGRN